MEKELTAIEWLAKQLPLRIINQFSKEIEQANEIFEQQIIDAFDNGKYITSGKNYNGEQYYKEQFKK